METLLSAAGACITSSLGLVARNSTVTIEDMRVSARATRESDLRTQEPFTHRPDRT
ncbi:MAG: hypothetical protein ACLFSP_08185 [Spirochaetaceae bacterium]